MITLSSIPTVVLARDPLPIDFATNNYQQTVGEKAACYINFLRLPVVGELFTITVVDSVYTFECATTPVELDYDFRAPSGETVNQFILNVLLPLLQSHYELNQIFRFYHNGTADRIYIEALQEGLITPFSIADTPGDLLTPAYPATFGVDAVYRENFKINYQVIDYATDQPISNIESLEPDANGEITVDISEYLHQLALNSFNLNAALLCQNMPNNITQVYLRYWESYGITTPVIYPMSKTAPFYLLEAATSWEEQARLNENGLWWYDNQLINKYFLTKMPQERNILPGQKLLLTWLHFAANPGFILKIKTKKTVNGSPVYTTIQYSISTQLPVQVFQIDVTPARWNMPADIEVFEVWITNVFGVTVSEIRTFFVDRSYYEPVRYFFFRNSLGGFDTIQGLGLGESEEEYKRERATKQMPSRFVITDRETQVLSVDSQLTFKANLGFMNLQGTGRELWANAIRQLYSSKEAYEIINNELYPIDILTDKQKLLEDNNYLPDFFVLEYTRAYVEKGAPSVISQLAGAYSQQYIDQYSGGFTELQEGEAQPGI